MDWEGPASDVGAVGCPQEAHLGLIAGGVLRQRPPCRKQLDRIVGLAGPSEGEGAQTRPERPPTFAEAALDQDLNALRGKLLYANQLVRLLHEQRGSPVTLLQTAIEARRAETLPNLPSNFRMAPRITPGCRMRL